jgi:hypothetical protein
MRRVLITLLLLLTALVPVGIVIAGDGADPGQPEWVDSEGKLKKDSIPAEFGVAGPDGAPVVCANGTQLKVKKADRYGPPPPPGRPVENTPGELVWRCGTGRNPHLNARLVPESQDPLKQSDG